MSKRPDPPAASGSERFAREGCECDRLGRSDDDECIYDDPCPNHDATLDDLFVPVKPTLDWDGTV